MGALRPDLVEEDLSFPLETPGSQFVCLTPRPSSAFLAVSVVTSLGVVGWVVVGVVECGYICSSKALIFDSGAARREVPVTASYAGATGRGWRGSGEHGLLSLGPEATCARG